MNLGIVGQAAGLFAVTNIDDILILSNRSFSRKAGGIPQGSRAVSPNGTTL